MTSLKLCDCKRQDICNLLMTTFFVRNILTSLMYIIPFKSNQVFFFTRQSLLCHFLSSLFHNTMKSTHLILCFRLLRSILYCAQKYQRFKILILISRQLTVLCESFVIGSALHNIIQKAIASNYYTQRKKNSMHVVKSLYLYFRTHLIWSFFGSLYFRMSFTNTCKAFLLF